MIQRLVKMAPNASRQAETRFAHPHVVDVGYRTVVELVDVAAVVLITVLLDSVLMLTPSMHVRKGGSSTWKLW